MEEELELVGVKEKKRKKEEKSKQGPGADHLQLEKITYLLKFQINSLTIFPLPNLCRNILKLKLRLPLNFLVF